MTQTLKVELLEHSGTDLTVVNAARVSYDVEHHELDGRDERLINFLAKNGHWTPFAHCFLTFRITAPIYVARQLGKHQVGLAWNEVSRRYVSSHPEYYLREEWHHAPSDSKQGKGEVFPSASRRNIRLAADEAMRKAVETYDYLIAMGVAPEQARGVLPQATLTSWFWSGSLMAFARVCNLRLDPHAQEESGIIASQIAQALHEHYPVCAKALLQ